VEEVEDNIHQLLVVQVVLVVVQKELKLQKELVLNQHKTHHLLHFLLSVNMEILVEMEQLLAHILLLVVVALVVQEILLVQDLVLVALVAQELLQQDLNIQLSDCRH
jgi:hypothetical protein